MRKMKLSVFWASLILACLLGQYPPQNDNGQERVRRIVRRSGTWRIEAHGS